MLKLHTQGEYPAVSSTFEKFIAAGTGLFSGIVVWYSVSLGWGIGACFGVYVVMLLDNILDRLDDLRRHGNAESL